MNKDQLRLCEIKNISGEYEKVWFHNWIVLHNSIVGVIEYEYGKIGYRLFQDIKFLDTPKIK